MSKKHIIMIGAVGLVSFTVMFIPGWLTGGPQIGPATAISQRGELGESIPTIEETDLKLPAPRAGTAAFAGAGSATAAQTRMKRAMTGKQLKSLVYEVREKIEEYNNKLQELEAREQRLQIAQDMLKKDTENLNNLRIELASTVANLKEEREKLLKSRIEITRAEKANLISIAAAYDKMDPAKAGEILTNMSQMQDSGGGSGFDDAVKILYCMTERTKAKLLAELTTSEPKLAAVLCQRLKQIVESE